VESRRKWREHTEYRRHLPFALTPVIVGRVYIPSIEHFNLVKMRVIFKVGPVVVQSHPPSPVMDE
jgi:hypothetical protein